MGSRLAVLALVAGVGLAQPGLAQDPGGSDPASGSLAEAIGGDQAGALRDAADAATEDQAAPQDSPERLAGEGGVGLIEAPEGEAGIDPSMLPGIGTGIYSDSADMPSFAERRSQARAPAVGPVDHPPVVVELFTSQGCSSCPPADEMLNDLADREGILALSWHVDYWDYLGWTDAFARPEFTRRQQAYAHAWGERAIYTPQMVVGGADTLIAVRPAELMALIEAQMSRPVPVLVTSSPQEGGYRIELTPRARLGADVAILLVRYVPRREVQIRTGENRGMDVTYRNVVLAVERIGEWDGRAPLRMSVKSQGVSNDAFPPDTRHAILAQQVSGDGKRRASGPILAAITLD